MNLRKIIELRAAGAGYPYGQKIITTKELKNVSDMDDGATATLEQNDKGEKDR